MELGYSQGMCDLLLPILVIFDDGTTLFAPPPSIALLSLPPSHSRGDGVSVLRATDANDGQIFPSQDWNGRKTVESAVIATGSNYM